ncbi:glutaminase A [Kineococcus terrestris]|uniref:glutaminase A n=1 Tax=Kineococcus terrestris TaxID=2044856 RepID=UPI0034DAC6A0
MSHRAREHDPGDLEAVLAEVAEEVRPRPGDEEHEEHGGEDAGRFGLAVARLDGEEVSTGDAEHPFPVQSIAKVFALTLALQKVGEDLFERVGREPSGDPYNSLIQLEQEGGRPRNPFINSGALVVCDVLLDCCDDPWAELSGLIADLTGADVAVDEEVLAAEGRRGHRNASMAYLMSSFGNVHHDVDEVMALYTRQSSALVDCHRLARAVRFLANDGVDPRTGRRVVSEQLARRINAVMLTTGTYDSAGQFAYEVGIPCKSGVSGAIVGDVPGRLGVSVWSPPLDPSGNSRAGRRALHLLVERLGLSVL